MDTHSKLIIAQETIRVTEVKNSYWMAVEGVKRCLHNISDHGVEIASLATVRHPSVRKTMEDDYNEIRHEYDLRHIVKNIKKRLLASKKGELTPWVNTIANHLWYCASACKGNMLLMKETRTSFLHHTNNQHTWTGGAEINSCIEFIPEYLHFRYYSAGMVKYIFDKNVYHYVIQPGLHNKH